MVERLKDGCALSQDTVGTEDGPLLLQVDNEVIRSVSGGVKNTTCRSFNLYHSSVLDLFKLYITGILCSEVDRMNIQNNLRIPPDLGYFNTGTGAPIMLRTSGTPPM